MPNPEKRFADYKAEGHVWTTLSTGEYYPDTSLGLRVL